jgi:hypothetical protein
MSDAVPDELVEVVVEEPPSTELSEALIEVPTELSEALIELLTELAEALIGWPTDLSGALIDALTDEFADSADYTLVS